MENIIKQKLIKRGFSEETLLNNRGLIGACIEETKEQLILSGVVSSAWYCKISNQNGQWFEIVTGKNEMDVAVKITEKFGKETVYNLIDRYELM